MEPNPPTPQGRPNAATRRRPNVPLLVENWRLIINTFVPDETPPYPQPGLRLTGTVSGAADGQTREIVTSPVRRRNGEAVVTATGHYYYLGEPHANYKAAYPNATALYLESLRDIADDPGSAPPMRLVEVEPEVEPQGEPEAVLMADLPDSFEDFDVTEKG